MTNRSLVSLVFASTSLVAGPVLAQESRGSVLEEVVVTAQKRAESVQDVPIAITALDDEFVAKSGIDDAEDMFLYVPGLSGRSASESESVFAIRGIGTNAFSVSADSSVGIFVDDIYQGHPIIAGAPFFDVERIEVIKGPQGTLFGRNTSAGAISVISKKPERDQNYLEGTVGFGNEGQQRFVAIGNFSPDSESGIRISAKHDQRDGVLINTTTGSDLNNVDSLFIRVNADKDFSDTVRAGLLLENYQSDARYGIMPFNPGDRQAALRNTTVTQNPPPPPGNVNVDTLRAGVRFEWDLSDSLTLTSLTSYLDSDLVALPVDGDNTTLNILNFREPSKYEYLAQDLRINGASDELDWFVGFNVRTEDNFANTEFSYSDEDVFLALLGDTCTNILGPGLCNTAVVEPSNATADNFSWGVYGDIKWLASENLTVTAGARFSFDDKEIAVNTPPSGSAVSLATTGGDGGIVELITDGTITNDEDWTNFSPRFAVTYSVAEDTQLYGNVAWGYKAGGFNSAPDIPLSALMPGEMQRPASFEPEESLAYEVGVKSTLAGGRARINAAAFFIDYEDYQLESFTGLSFNITNVADAENKGLEVESTFLVTDYLMLMFNYAYLDSEIQSGMVLPDPLLPPIDVSGSPLPFAPEHSYTFIADWTYPVNNMEISIRGEYAIADEMFLNLPANFTDFQENHNSANLRLGLDALDGRWSAAIIGENITDERWFENSQSVLTAVGVPNVGDLWRAEFTYRFGL